MGALALLPTGESGLSAKNGDRALQRDLRPDKAKFFGVSLTKTFLQQLQVITPCWI